MKGAERLSAKVCQYTSAQASMRYSVCYLLGGSGLLCQFQSALNTMSKEETLDIVVRSGFDELLDFRLVQMRSSELFSCTELGDERSVPHAQSKHFCHANALTGRDQ